MNILLDIEGTTTPIDFVHKTLFPFARDRVGTFVARNPEALGAELEAFQQEAERDIALGSYTAGFDRNSSDSVASYLRYLIDIDRKSTALKAIQGMIWKEGYEAGELRSEVYPDVPKAFERWRAQGRPASIFSSGSVLAQKLLFGHTSYGDLTRFISHYFDTNTGHKRESETYSRIAEALETDARDVLFVSDVDEELDAAAAAGMMTRLSIREGNPAQENDSGHLLIRSLEEIS
jgi:enolase-phosphatase E1